MEQKTLAIDGMSCEHCVERVKKALQGVPNLAYVQVDVGSAKVGADDKSRLDQALDAAMRALEAAGYPARPTQDR